MFTVWAGTSCGNPAFIAAWRAGFCPRPACSTLPMITSSTCSGATPARSKAARMTAAPSSVAETELRAPLNVPIGVRTALTMTASRFPIRIAPSFDCQL